MNINDTTDDGSTPLHLACQEGRYDTVKYILDLNDQTSNRRVDLNIKQRDRWSVLHVACYSGHTETVKLLIDAGMNVNERTRNGSTPLYLACQEGKYDTVKLLLNLNGQTLDSRVDTTIKDVDGFSVLHAASSARHSKIVKLLSDVGMNANDI
ncbi:RIPK4 [Mytilus edulis]|uniref:RIPK4 n=1 Tax=Mytilus edulis TaxID=6550 RepID=A0A8S3TPG9_MYTED|nr:RIPK4 [Mytilus edulis]